MNYYVRLDGSNGNTGTSNTSGGAWRTVAYAATTVTTGIHTINVGAGTFNEGTNEIVLEVGVSLDGAGKTSTIIISHVQVSRQNYQPQHASITMVSSTQGTNGNQTLSNFTLDGECNDHTNTQIGTISGSVSYMAMIIRMRSNVIIHDCIIQNFWSGGILFHGCQVNSQPTIYAVGNQVYNCSILNCVDESDVGAGAGACIEIGAQSDMEIHDNIITQNQRYQGHNGDLIQSAYYERGIKIYKNIFTKPGDNGSAFNFHIEIWDTEGGWEVYNNEFYGGDCAIDIAGHFNRKTSFVDAVTYPYSWWIHDNYFEGFNLYDSASSNKVTIIIEDDYVEDIIVERNHFYHCPTVIAISNGSVDSSDVKRITFAYNWVEDCGWADGNYGHLVAIEGQSTNCFLTDVFIYNNYFEGSKTASTSWADGFWVICNGSIHNLQIKNNIIRNCKRLGWLAVENSYIFDGFTVTNNLIYDCAHSNNIYLYPNDGWHFHASSGPTILNYTYSGNLAGIDPQLDSSYKPIAGSPVINAGVNVGYTKDYMNTSLVGNPDIGIYEYVSVLGVVVSTKPIINITETSFISGGSVSFGDASVIEKGLCYSTSPSPTIANIKIVATLFVYDAGPTPPFYYSVTVNSILPGTLYYVRAYATHAEGTTYGNELNIITGSSVFSVSNVPLFNIGII